VTLGELWVSAASAMWQIEYRYRQYAIVSTALAAVKLALPVLLILLPFTFPGDSARARIVGTAIASVAFGIFLFRYLMMRGKTWYRRDFWRYALLYGVPLIPHALSGFILAHFDRILTDRYVGRAAAGLYTFAYQIGEITSMLWYASNSAWVPWFFEQMGQKQYALIRQRANQYVLAFAALSGLMILAGPLIVRVFAPPEYQVAGRLVPIIMCSQFFNLGYSLYANVEFFEKRTAYISVGTVLAAVVNVILNVIWLPIYGYSAAAWATLISYILLFVFHAAIVKYALRSQATFNLPLLTMSGATLVAFSTIIYLLT
jgi:O-antigen/teichoic acid export membrane protein